MHQTKRYDFVTAKKRWREICNDSSVYMPIYHKDWYWDACCSSADDWSVIVYEDENAVAGFPFLRFKKLCLWRIETPWAVSRGGPWIIYKTDHLSEDTKLALNEHIHQYIIDILPPFDHFFIKWSPDLQIGISFPANGFRLNTFCNHYLESISREDCYHSLSASRRLRVKKGEKDYQIEVNNIGVDAICDFFFRNFANENKLPLYQRSQMKQLLEALFATDALRAVCAYNNDELQAISLFLVDERSVYHQFCSHRRECKNGDSLIVYKEIEYTMSTGRKFDFEGSVLPGVAAFNQSFGAKQETVIALEKMSTKFCVFNKIKKLINP